MEGKIFAGLNRLENLRREEIAFSARADFWTWDTGSDNVLGLGRWLDGELLLGVFNFSGESRKVPLDDVYTDLITGQEWNGSMQVDGLGFSWLKQKL